MLLRADKFESYLADHPLAEVSLICGDEILLNIENLDLLREKAKSEGYQERKRIEIKKDSVWKNLINEIDTPSLFSSKLLLECHVDDKKLSKTATDVLKSLAAMKIPTHVRIIIYAENLEVPQRTPWFKALEKVNFVCARSYSLNHLQFQQQVQRRLRKASVNLDEKAFKQLINYVAGNLLAAQQSIDRLTLIDKEEFSAADLRDALSDLSRFQIADFRQAVFSQKWLSAYQIACKIEDENKNALLKLNWQLERDCSVLLSLQEVASQQWPDVFSRYRIYSQQQYLYQNAIKLFRAPLIVQLLKLIAKIDAISKGAEFGDAWLTLKQYLLLKSVRKAAKKTA